MFHAKVPSYNNNMVTISFRLFSEESFKSFRVLTRVNVFSLAAKMPYIFGNQLFCLLFFSHLETCHLRVQ